MKALNVNTLTLRYGAHGSDSPEYCLLEAVSVYCPVAGGLRIEDVTKTDHPADVDPVLAAFGRSWNDGLPSDAERNTHLKRYIPRLCNTNRGAALSERRSWMVLDWLVRVHLPAWLDLTPSLEPHAKSLRECQEIASVAGAKAAQSCISAARAAAWAAAGAAAGDAAGDAAGAAAGDAAWAALWAAAGDALAPTVVTLQSSAHDLYSRMIDAEVPA